MLLGRVILIQSCKSLTRNTLWLGFCDAWIIHFMRRDAVCLPKVEGGYRLSVADIKSGFTGQMFVTFPFLLCY